MEGRARDRAAALRPHGQQRGAPGHAPNRLTQLSAREAAVALRAPQCPACAVALRVVTATDDSEVLEIDVQAYRRLIRRQRYRFGCSVLPRNVAAPAPPPLIERGKFGISVWVNVLLDKFVHRCLRKRRLHELSDHGLPKSACIHWHGCSRSCKRRRATSCAASRTGTPT